MKGKVSFYEQTPVILKKTVKENILFDRSFDKKRYDEIMEVLKLKEDLEYFPYGEDSLIGENGVALSNSQKTRICLARTLYSDVDIYLFDDPLSSLDSKFCQSLIENVFLKMLKGKTIILNTHHTHFLESCNEVIHLEKGEIVGINKPSEI